MANKLITVTQLDDAAKGFSNAVAEADYEQRENLKALAYKDDVTMDVLSKDLKVVLGGKMTKTRTQEIVNEKVGEAYKPGGSKTLATLPPLAAINSGNVYHMTEEFVTTDDFVEGAGKTYPFGSEVAVVEIPGATGNDPSTYKYNVLSGYVDTSKFASQSSFSLVKDALDKLEIATQNDIQGIIDGLGFGDEVWDYDLDAVDDGSGMGIMFVSDNKKHPENIILKTNKPGVTLSAAISEGVGHYSGELETEIGKFYVGNYYHYDLFSDGYSFDLTGKLPIKIAFPEVPGFKKVVYDEQNIFHGKVATYLDMQVGYDVLVFGNGEGLMGVHVTWDDDDDLHNARPDISDMEMEYIQPSKDNKWYKTTTINLWDRWEWIWCPQNNGNEYFGDPLLIRMPQVPGYTMTVHENRSFDYGSVTYKYVG